MLKTIDTIKQTVESVMRNKLYVFLLILLASSQVFLYVDLSRFNIDKDTTISLFPFILLGTLIWTIFRRSRQVWSTLQENRSLILTTVAFIGYALVSTIIRYIKTGDITLSVAPTIYLLLGIILFIVLCIQKLEFDKTVAMFVFGMTIIHLVVFINIFMMNDVRGLAVLGNINIYLALAMTIAPLLVFAFRKNTFFKYFTGINILAMFTVAILSGSRFGIWAVMTGVIAGFSIYYGWKFIPKILCITVISVVSCVFIALLLGTFNYSLRDNIARTFGTSANSINSLYSKIGINTEYNLTPEIPEKPAVINADIDEKQIYSGLPEPSESRVLNRNWILNETFKALEGNILLGRGSHLVKVGGWGMHSPHNFILELLLLYGAIGSVLYALVYRAVFKKITPQLKNSAHLKASLVGMILILAYSLVQPLVVSQMAVIAVIWILLACCVVSIDDSEEAHKNAV